MTDVLPNPALALHGILSQLTQSSARSVADGWGLALGCEVGSPEFPRRHAEVVGLFTDTLTRVEALPAGVTLKARVARYAPAWYAAVVFTGNSWSTTSAPPSGILDLMVLDHLQAVGEQLSERQDEPRVDGSTVDAILKNLEEWEAILEEGGLPADVVGQIRGHVSQIRWLVSNVDRFGASRVIAESNQLAGAGVSAMARSTKPSVRQKVGAAIAGLLFFVNLANGFVDDVTGVIDGVAAMPDKIHELVIEYRDPLELEANTPLELERGPESPDDGVVDAETVPEN
ncbi:hypothetical protein J2W18_002299 [Rhodococcus cercidiphylli]|nr:hypothetical protein [Rhodococcus cercidiphylli]